MNIVIRTDASVEIGTGHVMRCLTLAKQLKCQGAEVTFVCREFEGNSISYIQDQGISVCSLPSIDADESDVHWTKEHWRLDAGETVAVIKGLDDEVDLLIVDHYGMDSRWESTLRDFTNHIMVIDDLADRPHDCNLLLDQNYYSNMQKRYKGLVSDQCVQMLGPDYVLLRDEFLQAAEKPRERTGEVKNILVFFGGTDPTEETIKALEVIVELNIQEIEINLVVGASNPKREEIEQLCSVMPNVNYFCQVSNMAELMWEADLAIGAGGATTWERCFLGLPSIVIILAPNQLKATTDVAKNGSIINLGFHNEVTVEYLKKVIIRLIENPEEVKKMITKNIVNQCKVEQYLVLTEILDALK